MSPSCRIRSGFLVTLYPKREGGPCKYLHRTDQAGWSELSP